MIAPAGRGECALRCAKMRLIAIASILVFLPGIGSSLTVRTQDMMFVSNAKYAIERFRDENGRFPVEWSDLDLYFDQGIDEVGKYIQGTQRYQLFGAPVSFSEPFSGRLVVISRRSFSDIDHGLTWYGSIGSSLGTPEFRGIVLTSNDTLVQTTFTEVEMAKLIRSAGNLKITEDSLPERAHVAKLRRKIVVARTLGAMFAGFFVLILARFITQRRRHNSSRQATASPSPAT